MGIPEKLLEIHSISGQGYTSLVSYHSWRVAMAGFAPHLTPEQLPYFEKHLETDEVFISLGSGGLLYIAGCDEKPGKIQVHKLGEEEICNVRCGVWHALSLKPESRVVIVENDNTSTENTLRLPVEESQRTVVIQLAREVMGDR